MLVEIWASSLPPVRGGCGCWVDGLSIGLLLGPAGPARSWPSGACSDLGLGVREARSDPVLGGGYYRGGEPAVHLSGGRVGVRWFWFRAGMV
jgi:hypothetical protein